MGEPCHEKCAQDPHKGWDMCGSHFDWSFIVVSTSGIEEFAPLVYMALIDST